MSMSIGSIFAQAISVIGYGIEAVGVAIIIAGSIWATRRMLRDRSTEAGKGLYYRFKRDVGRALMLGLEFLVAGDIIRTVVVAHSLADLLSLGLLVLIRTVLVFTIHLEVEGRWPWQPAPANTGATAG